MGVCALLAKFLVGAAAVVAVLFVASPTITALPTMALFQQMWPNVLYVSASDVAGVAGEPFSISAVGADDNIFGGALTDLSFLSGVYYHQPQFFHPAMERIVPSEKWGSMTVWVCAVGCSGSPLTAALPAADRGGEESEKEQLRRKKTTIADRTTALVHINEPKNSRFLMLEFFDAADAPLQFARSKKRASATMDVPFVSVEDRAKASTSPVALRIYSLWLALARWEGIVSLVVAVAGLVYILVRRSGRSGEDDW